MKKLSLLFLLPIFMVLSGCRDIVNTVLDIIPPIEVPYSSQQEISFATISSTSYTRAPEVMTNVDLDAQIKASNPKYGIENLKSVKMSEMKATYISSALGNKLDVIKNMQIYIKAPNLPEKLIATVYNNTSANTITFTMTNAEILDYFRTPQNSLIVEIQGNSVSADKIKMNLESVFKVKVQL